MAAYRVGIIGSGGIARTHAKGWQAAGCELAACCDIRLESARKLAEEFAIPAAHEGVEALLAADPCDLYSICTWPGSHAACTIAAAAAGAKGIICEKAMGRDLAECQAMIAATDAAGCKLAIGHHHRFLPVNATIHRLVAEGAIGQPVLSHDRIAGGLANNGSHMIDRMRYWLADEPLAWVMGQVERQTNRHERGEPCEDRTVATYAFANGCRYILETDTPEAALAADRYLLGTAGALRLVGRAELFRLAAGSWEPVPLDPSTDQFSELLAWLAGETEHRNAAARSWHTVEAMMAVYESVRTRQLVELPVTNQANPLRQLIDGGRLPLTQPEPYDIRL